MISATVNIENFVDSKIDFAESFLNNSIRILDFFNKWPGLIGKFIVFILIIPFLALFIIVFNFYLKNLSKKMSMAAGALLKDIPTFSFQQVKDFENSILPFNKKISHLYNTYKPLEGNILFKQLGISISSIYFNFEAINNALLYRYTYSRDELSAEQLQSVTDYWNKVKKNKPEIFKILAADKSGEEVIFNSKKIQ